MCDCAETFHRKCCPRNDDEEPRSDSRPPPGDNSKKAVFLAMSALLCGLFGFLLYSLDRRTVKKILTMLGLGFLFAQPTETIHKPCIPKPNPCLKRSDPIESKESPESKSCKCREKKQPCAPPPPPACPPIPPPPEKKCRCCPNS